MWGAAGLLEASGIEVKTRSLYSEILRDEAVARLNELGKNLYESGINEGLKSETLICEWMEDAGLRTWVDSMGNLHGRVDGMNAKCSSSANWFSYGIISTISVLEVLKSNGKLGELKRPVKASHRSSCNVIAFSDEEGVRFQSTFLGSAAVAGVLPVTAMNISDKSGVTVQDALKGNPIEITKESLWDLNYDPALVWGYVELHIEQGPVLEWTGFPLAVVTVRGSQGHAGIVPMSMRRDPMSAAAELIVLLESLCTRPREFFSDGGNFDEYTLESLSTSLVCTVGEISTWPSANNVTFTVDLRTIDDVGREAVVYELSNQIYKLCDRSAVSCIIERKHDAKAVICDQELSSRLQSAAYTAVHRMTGDSRRGSCANERSRTGKTITAAVISEQVGMLFVLCRGGISHSPEEHVLDDDVWAAGIAVLAFLESRM
ncbi:Allantoate deiminase [Hibiscus syriacus]|uniref:Allantoate deiminase n=1 Tax=Hibiscus syriacus TaxID=106335 RepID=A0A6A2Y552_HIBSY|nr:Allantoate deiminase [Hibiscus syriacus]